MNIRELKIILQAGGVLQETKGFKLGRPISAFMLLHRDSKNSETEVPSAMVWKLLNRQQIHTDADSITGLLIWGAPSHD